MPLTKDQKRDRLGVVPLFRGCSPASLQRLAEVTGEVDFPADQPIVNQGQIGNGLFVLVAGTARVARGSETLAHLGVGDFFGELGVLDQLPRMASVIAETPCSCLALASWDLFGVVDADPQLTRNLLRELSLRLRAASGEHHHH